MYNKPLGCLSVSGLLTAAITLLVILALWIVQGGRMFSPGPLNAQTGALALGGVRSHAELGGRCAACHPSPLSIQSMAEYCLKCHTNLANDTQNFHRMMIAEGQAYSCGSCHEEHSGAETELIVADLKNFSHDQFVFSLRTHQAQRNGETLICSDCHSGNFKLFDPRRCVACHGGFDANFIILHQDSFGSDCLACHDGMDRFGRQWDHWRAVFSLAGKHAGVSCDSCHPNARSAADLQATPQDCAACHAQDDAHQGSFGSDCAGCHTPEDWKQGVSITPGRLSN